MSPGSPPHGKGDHRLDGYCPQKEGCEETEDVANCGPNRGVMILVSKGGKVRSCICRGHSPEKV